jgi:PhnB protein
MANVSLEPYLFFKGQAKEAMEFYKSVFGGELTVSSYAETPGMENTPGVQKDWLMHASLEGGAVKLMGSDTAEASEQSKKVTLSLGGTDEAAMREMFDKLSAGGSRVKPLEKMFWGDIYGDFTDKYGVDWMMNIGAPKEGE